MSVHLPSMGFVQSANFYFLLTRVFAAFYLECVGYGLVFVVFRRNHDVHIMFYTFFASFASLIHAAWWCCVIYIAFGGVLVR